VRRAAYSAALGLALLLGGGSVATLSEAQNSDKVNVYRQYDKKRRETRTLTEIMLIYGPDPGPYSIGFGLSMTAGYAFPGQTPAPPETFTLNFLSSENHEVFAFKHDLTIKADDDTLQPPVEYKRLGNGTAIVTEQMIATVPAAAFARIANAGKVQVQLGEKKFTLTERQQKNLQALLASAPR
jgi:hypothetical protein